MESLPENIVILVADGEDTPREMYKKTISTLDLNMKHKNILRLVFNTSSTSNTS